MTQIAFGTPEPRITDAELQQELERAEAEKPRLADQGTSDDVAERWGIGQPGSEDVRGVPRQHRSVHGSIGWPAR